MRRFIKIERLLSKNIASYRGTSSKSEKRPLVESEDDVEIKRPRTEGTDATESILDDIRLEEIESRIEVHVLESPASCTHEVAVYPGNYRYHN